MARNKYILAVGFAFSDPDVNFNAALPFRACLLCGRVFQCSDLERRDKWAQIHARRSHTQTEHYMLMLSGLVMTAEAAQRLAAFGIIPISDMVLNEEVEAALLEAPSRATQEVES